MIANLPTSITGVVLILCAILILRIEPLKFDLKKGWLALGGLILAAGIGIGVIGISGNVSLGKKSDPQPVSGSDLEADSDFGFTIHYELPEIAPLQRQEGENDWEIDYDELRKPNGSKKTNVGAPIKMRKNGRLALFAPKLEELLRKLEEAESRTGPEKDVGNQNGLLAKGDLISVSIQQQAERAIEKRQRGNYKESLDELGDIIADSPNYYGARYQRAMTYLAAGDLDSALKEFQEADKIRQEQGIDDPSIQNAIGHALVRLKRPEEAAKKLELLLADESLPDELRQRAFNNLSQAYFDMGNLKRAAETVDNASRIQLPAESPSNDSLRKELEKKQAEYAKYLEATDDLRKEIDTEKEKTKQADTTIAELERQLAAAKMAASAQTDMLKELKRISANAVAEAKASRTAIAKLEADNSAVRSANEKMARHLKWTRHHAKWVHENMPWVHIPYTKKKHALERLDRIIETSEIGLEGSD